MFMTDRVSDSPLVNIHQVFQLSTYGVKQEQVSYPRVTMASHRWVCCRHSSKKKKKDNCITAINLTRKTPRPLTWPCIADSAMMNPRKPWLALKVGRHFQVFNIVAEKQLFRCTVKDNVQYWTWINDDIIGMVGSKFVYHWDLSPPGDSGLQKVFERHMKLSCSQIVAYKADPSCKWFALVGLYKDFDNESDESNYVSGVAQIHCIENQCCQCIDAQAVTFTSYRRSDNQKPTSILCLANRSPAQQGKIHIIELGPHISGNTALSSFTEQLYFDETDRYDFPVSIQVCPTYGLVYVLTKYGHVKVCDIESAQHLCSARASPLTIFTAVPDTEGKKVIGIDRCGKLLSIGVAEKALINHVQANLKRPAIATRLKQSMFPPE
ncbi:clathrin heavy chain 2-like [Amphiura filiformis]|uniref:clathrin heavy chain 2-like n=1 Tax=Amphiura filiformis TaxID=82378 RepID=UPI003B2141A4